MRWAEDSSCRLACIVINEMRVKMRNLIYLLKTKEEIKKERERGTPFIIKYKGNKASGVLSFFLYAYQPIL